MQTIMSVPERDLRGGNGVDNQAASVCASIAMGCRGVSNNSLALQTNSA